MNRYLESTKEEFKTYINKYKNALEQLGKIPQCNYPLTRTEETKMNNYLKPCPFCGSKAEVITLGDESGELNIGAQCIQCTNKLCNASSGLIYPLMDNVLSILVERWNSRFN